MRARRCGYGRGGRGSQREHGVALVHAVDWLPGPDAIRCQGCCGCGHGGLGTRQIGVSRDEADQGAFYELSSATRP